MCLRRYNIWVGLLELLGMYISSDLETKSGSYLNMSIRWSSCDYHTNLSCLIVSLQGGFIMKTSCGFQIMPCIIFHLFIYFLLFPLTGLGLTPTRAFSVHKANCVYLALISRWISYSKNSLCQTMACLKLLPHPAESWAHVLTCSSLIRAMHGKICLAYVLLPAFSHNLIISNVLFIYMNSRSFFQ